MIDISSQVFQFHSHSKIRFSKKESLMEEITDKFHGHDSSTSSSDSDDDDSSSTLKSDVYRLFGREKPVHKVLGGGKSADVLLWRNRKISGGVLAGATAIWVLFELLHYQLLTLVCHVLMLALGSLFLWSNVSIFINKSPPRIPEISVPSEPIRQIVSLLISEMNQTFEVLRDIASGKDLKQFLYVMAGLWIASVIGSFCDFLTLFYIVFVFLHTIPVLYEKYEEHVDSFGEKAIAEMKRQYQVFDAKVLSKIPTTLSTKGGKKTA